MWLIPQIKGLKNHNLCPANIISSAQDTKVSTWVLCLLIGTIKYVVVWMWSTPFKLMCWILGAQIEVLFGNIGRFVGSRSLPERDAHCMGLKFYNVPNSMYTVWQQMGHDQPVSGSYQQEDLAWWLVSPWTVSQKEGFFLETVYWQVLGHSTAKPIPKYRDEKQAPSWENLATWLSWRVYLHILVEKN